MWEVKGRSYRIQELKIAPPRSYWAVSNSYTRWQGKAPTLEAAVKDWAERNGDPLYVYENLTRVK